MTRYAPAALFLSEIFHYFLDCLARLEYLVAYLEAACLCVLALGILENALNFGTLAESADQLWYGGFFYL